MIWYYLVHDNFFVSGLDWGTIIEFLENAGRAFDGSRQAKEARRKEADLPLSYLVAEELTLDKLMEILKDEEEEEKPTPIPEWK